MLLQSIFRHGALLALFALLSTAVIAVTWVNTEDRIQAQQRAAAARALLEVVPPSLHDNSMLDDTAVIVDTTTLRVDDDKRIHLARLHGEVVAAIVPVVAPDGYSGRISLIVGIDRRGRITGVRVLQHRETPGLGDHVELRKSDWILAFNGRSLQDPSADGWAVRKDHGEFDQFTGATITPRAVVAAVHRALEYFDAHKAQLLKTEDGQHG